MPGRGRNNPGIGFGRARYPGAFLLVFREAIAQLGWELRRFHRDLAECRDADGKEYCIGLENLYRRARRTPREEWPQLFNEFLQTIAVAEQSENLPESLDDVAGQLLVRLGPPLKLASAESRVWCHALTGTGLVVNLVVDYPNRMCYVTEDLIARSDEPGTVWMERARANLRERTPADCLEVIHEESGLMMCSTGDAYDSSRALLLEDLVPHTKAEGYLVVVPGRDELLVMPVTAASLPHVHLLKMLAESNFKTAPYPISDEVYWIQGGEWHPFPMAVRSGEVDVQPPARFLEILRALATEEPEGNERD